MIHKYIFRIKKNSKINLIWISPCGLSICMNFIQIHTDWQSIWTIRIVWAIRIVQFVWIIRIAIVDMYVSYELLIRMSFFHKKNVIERECHHSINNHSNKTITNNNNDNTYFEGERKWRTRMKKTQERRSSNEGAWPTKEENEAGMEEEKAKKWHNNEKWLVGTSHDFFYKQKVKDILIFLSLLLGVSTKMLECLKQRPWESINPRNLGYG